MVTGFGLKKIVDWKESILHLIYPSSCLICENELASFEKNTCSFCQDDLKFTSFESYSDDSPLDKLFWGRAQLDATFSMLYFEKGSNTQKILHNIKYKSKKDLGVEMGELMGTRIAASPAKYGNIDALIPVPLHPKKQYIRGYNQSECIAEGISRTLGIPVNTTFLTRVQHAESQTKKNRFLRWDNIEEAFYVRLKNNETLKHIAIVDDVITTGSTLEACIQKIRAANPEIKISLFSLAIAK